MDLINTILPMQKNNVMRYNYITQKHLSWLLVLLMLFNGESWGQTTIFTENMGTPTGTTTIAGNTFQNSTGSLTYSTEHKLILRM